MVEISWKSSLFVKEGTVLPLAEVEQCVRSDTVFRITPFVYSDGPGKGCLYDADPKIMRG